MIITIGAYRVKYPGGGGGSGGLPYVKKYVNDEGDCRKFKKKKKNLKGTRILFLGAVYLQPLVRYQF